MDYFDAIMASVRQERTIFVELPDQEVGNLAELACTTICDDSDPECTTTYYSGHLPDDTAAHWSVAVTQSW